MRNSHFVTEWIYLKDCRNGYISHRQKIVGKYDGSEIHHLRNLNRFWILDDYYRYQLEGLHD